MWKLINTEKFFSKLQFQFDPAKEIIKMFKVFLTFALIFAVECARVNVRQCSPNVPTPNWVESDLCTTERCTMFRGQTFVARVNFVPGATFQTLTTDIKANVLGINFPVDVPEGYENICQFLENASCPVTADGNYISQVRAPVGAAFPAISGITVQSKSFGIFNELQVNTNYFYSFDGWRKSCCKLRNHFGWFEINHDWFWSKFFKANFWIFTEIKCDVTFAKNTQNTRKNVVQQFFSISLFFVKSIFCCRWN